VPVLAVAEATLFGIASAVSLLIGVVLTVAGYIANRRTAAEKAAEEAHALVLEAQRESERLSEELHKLRMERRDETAE
jgi:signal transduction histidine kinase